MRKRRGYFKHYNDATTGQTLRRVLAKKKPYSYILFWVILEKCNQMNSYKGTIGINELAHILCCRSDEACRIILETIELIPEIKLQTSQDLRDLSLDCSKIKLHFSAPNYSVYKDTSLSSTIPSTSKAASVIVEDKPKSLVFNAVDDDDVLAHIPKHTVQRWEKLYPNVAWRTENLYRAIGYYFDNPDKKPRSVSEWCNCISSWLSKNHMRKSSNTRSDSNTRSAPKSKAQIRDEKIFDMLDRINKGEL